MRKLRRSVTAWVAAALCAGAPAAARARVHVSVGVGGRIGDGLAAYWGTGYPCGAGYGWGGAPWDGPGYWHGGWDPWCYGPRYYYGGWVPRHSSSLALGVYSEPWCWDDGLWYDSAWSGVGVVYAWPVGDTEDAEWGDPPAARAASNLNSVAAIWPATTVHAAASRAGEVLAAEGPDPSVIYRARPIGPSRIQVPDEIRSLIRAGETAAASQQIARLLARSPNAVNLRAADVVARWAGGDVEGATFALWRLLGLREQADVMSARLDLADLLGSEAKLDELLAGLSGERIEAAAASDAARLQLLLGWGLIQAGRLDAARLALERVLQASPGSRQALDLLAALARAEE